MEEITTIFETNIDSRAKAREYAFAMLFAKSFAPEEAADVWFARELEDAEIDFGKQIDYIRAVYFGVCDNLEAIDEKLSGAAVGWNLSRITKSSLSIMRLCVCEMLNIDDVPRRVALNEAVELAKKYDDEKTVKFVNGVLNTVAKSLPAREIDK